MMFAEDDLMPISTLQHYVFCKRQCALIHIEQVWAENRLTAEGRILHDKVHNEGSETRPNIRICRALRLRSLRLGLTGIADVVEFHADPEGEKVPGLRGKWRPCPVEFKRGRPKPDRCDEVQVCAQAMCLEEMLDISVNESCIYYGQPRRRQIVKLGRDLRDATEEIVRQARLLLSEGITPPAEAGPKCRSCSLLDICLPESAGVNKSARRYLGQMLSE